MSSASVSRVATGNTNANRSRQISSDPDAAVTTSAASGAATASAAHAAAPRHGPRPPVRITRVRLLVEADAVYELACRVPMSRDFGQRRAVTLQGPQFSDKRVNLCALFDRILEISLGVDLLRGIGNEILEQLNSLGMIWRVSRNSRTRDVHMRTTILERRQNDLDRCAPLLLIRPAAATAHEADVIGIGDTKLAEAAQDVARNVAVTACCRTSLIGLEAGSPLLRCSFAMMRDMGTEQSRVVRMLS